MTNFAVTFASTATAREPGARTLRVLYADDVRELRDIMRFALQRDGHTVDCFADGAEARDRCLTDRNYDLIITDHHMPRMNGLEFVTELRRLGFVGRLMVFSSELSELVAQEYRKLSVDRILYKPVFPSALRKTLEELFPSPASIAA